MVHSGFQGQDRKMTLSEILKLKKTDGEKKSGQNNLTGRAGSSEGGDTESISGAADYSHTSPEESWFGFYWS